MKMRTLNIEDFAPHSFIVIFDDNSHISSVLVQRVLKSQTDSATTTIEDKKNPLWTEDKNIQDIARRGRYDKASLVVRLSEPKDIPSHIKYYIDYIIIPRHIFVDCEEKRRRLYNTYGRSVPFFNDFVRILDASTLIIADGRPFIAL